MEKVEHTESRKAAHIDLAFKSRLGQPDPRFNYEPLFAAHPKELLRDWHFAGKTMKAPIWISSMTGGTEMAGKINKNLAKVCNEFKLGMGLGSCRIILFDDTYFKDFNLRPIIGQDLPFFANLGVAQVEELLIEKKADVIANLVKKLDADGLILHVNPLQEATQPEGDRFKRSPLQTLEELLNIADYKIIVKEVGQGMGPGSLKKLMALPLEAIDFGAAGGTNFSIMELLRNDEVAKEVLEPIAKVGHSATEMAEIINSIIAGNASDIKTKSIIASGGIKNFLDGYYCIEKLEKNAIFGMASGFLKHAMEDYEQLQKFTHLQIEGLKLAYALLRIKK